MSPSAKFSQGWNEGWIGKLIPWRFFSNGRIPSVVCNKGEDGKVDSAKEVKRLPKERWKDGKRKKSGRKEFRQRLYITIFVLLSGFFSVQAFGEFLPWKLKSLSLDLQTETEEGEGEERREPLSFFRHYFFELWFHPTAAASYSSTEQSKKKGVGNFRPFLAPILHSFFIGRDIFLLRPKRCELSSGHIMRGRGGGERRNGPGRLA